MQKTLLLLVICIAFCGAARSQTKMNFYVAEQLKKQRIQTMDVMVQGDPSVVRQCVERNGGKFRYTAGNISSVNISLEGISKLLSSPGVQRIEGNPNHIKLMSDT